MTAANVYRSGITVEWDYGNRKDGSNEQHEHWGRYVQEGNVCAPDVGHNGDTVPMCGATADTGVTNGGGVLDDRVSRTVEYNNGAGTENTMSREQANERCRLYR